MAGQAKAQRRFGYLADRRKYQKSNINPSASEGLRRDAKAK
jgi:hypothetical protein